MSVAVIDVAPSITWLLVITSPDALTTMPVPAAAPPPPSVVLMSTSPESTRAAVAATDTDVVAPEDRDGDDAGCGVCAGEPADHAKCAIAAPASAAATPTPAPVARPPRRAGPRRAAGSSWGPLPSGSGGSRGELLIACSFGCRGGPRPIAGRV